MNYGRLMAAGLALSLVGAAWAGPDGDKIAADSKVLHRGTLQGFDWTIVDFEGCEAWLVEPKTPAADGRWVWCMEWPTAFQDRTGVKRFLEAGYRWVAFNPAYSGWIKTVAGNQTEEMVEKRCRWQKYLISKLGLNKKCGLIGMSWGGFYSVRYASIHPECVAAIYLDAPCLDFTTLKAYKAGEYKKLQAFYDFATADYVGADDPFQSVNRAALLAKARIPLLVLYGGKDVVVPPEKNIERFAPVFEANGGVLTIMKRGIFGHHPHGLDPSETGLIVNFFENAFNPPQKVEKKK